jgi:hypothetical protein
MLKPIKHKGILKEDYATTINNQNINVPKGTELIRYSIRVFPPKYTPWMVKDIKSVYNITEKDMYLMIPIKNELVEELKDA